MPVVTLSPATLADATDLIRANRDSRAHHAPWVRPFTDQDGFDRWFGRLVEGTDVALVAREERSGSIVGVTHLIPTAKRPDSGGVGVPITVLI